MAKLGKLTLAEQVIIKGINARTRELQVANQQFDDCLGENKTLIRELADKYQSLFNFMSQEHGLTLTISEMDDVIMAVEDFKINFNEDKK